MGSTQETLRSPPRERHYAHLENGVRYTQRTSLGSPRQRSQIHQKVHLRKVIRTTHRTLSDLPNESCQGHKNSVIGSTRRPPYVHPQICFPLCRVLLLTQHEFCSQAGMILCGVCFFSRLLLCSLVRKAYARAVQVDRRKRSHLSPTDVADSPGLLN